MLRLDQGDRSELLTLSLWENLNAIRAFAGDDIEAAVLYPEGARYLPGESTVTHHQVVDRSRTRRTRRGTIGSTTQLIATSPVAHKDADPCVYQTGADRPRGLARADAVVAAQVGWTVQPMRSCRGRVPSGE